MDCALIIPNTCAPLLVHPAHLVTTSVWLWSPANVDLKFSRHDDDKKTGSSSSSGPPEVPKLQINKYTGRPFSAKFWTILEKRRGLPVWDYYNKFMDTVKENPAVVLVGETGSGKTTQVRARPGGRRCDC